MKRRKKITFSHRIKQLFYKIVLKPFASETPQVKPRYKRASRQNRGTAVKGITISKIQKETAKYLNVPVEEIIERQNGWNKSPQRNIAMYLSCQLTAKSYAAISDAFNYKCRDITVRAYREISLQRQSDKKLDADLQKLTEIITGKKTTQEEITIVSIQKAVATYYKMSLQKITTKCPGKRNKMREIAMYLCTELTVNTGYVINAAFDSKPNSKASWEAHKRIEQQRQSDKKLDADLQKLTEIITEARPAKQKTSKKNTVKVMTDYQKKQAGLRTVEKTFSIPIIKKETAKYYEIKVGELTSKKKGAQDVFAGVRYVAIYLSRQLTLETARTIGKHFRGRKPSTIREDYKAVAAQIKTDKTLEQDCNNIIKILNGEKPLQKKATAIPKIITESLLRKRNQKKKQSTKTVEKDAVNETYKIRAGGVTTEAKTLVCKHKKIFETLTIELIKIITAKHYRVSMFSLASKTRKSKIVRARRMAMALSRRLTPHTLQQIGCAFGGRDHSTVLTALKFVNKKLKSDDEWQEDFNTLLRKLGNYTPTDRPHGAWNYAGLC